MKKEFSNETKIDFINEQKYFHIKVKNKLNAISQKGINHANNDLFESLIEDFKLISKPSQRFSLTKYYNTEIRIVQELFYDEIRNRYKNIEKERRFIIDNKPYTADLYLTEKIENNITLNITFDFKQSKVFLMTGLFINRKLNSTITDKSKNNHFYSVIISNVHLKKLTDLEL